MKRGRFDELSLQEKALIVHEFAHQLTSIEYYNFRIHLFSLNGHFIELYQHVDTRQIHNISMATYNDIDKYLSRIVLGSLKLK